MPLALSDHSSKDCEEQAYEKQTRGDREGTEENFLLQVDGKVYEACDVFRGGLVLIREEGYGDGFGGLVDRCRACLGRR